MIPDILIPLIATSLAELGDKTQITSGPFATQYNSLLVLIGVMTALTLLSIMTIYLGRFISSKVNTKTISRIAGIMFIGMGTLIVASIFLF